MENTLWKVRCREIIEGNYLGKPRTKFVLSVYKMLAEYPHYQPSECQLHLLRRFYASHLKRVKADILGDCDCEE